jgi:Putative motility protein
MTDQPEFRWCNHKGVSMDVSAIASLATQMSQAQTADAVQVAVLKKAMDVQEQSALQLLQAIPNNPPNLGNNVDQFV